MSLRLDHAIILIYNLEQASTAYREAGFNVVYGGQHAGGKTHNALIVFHDSTYLELLAPTDPDLLRVIDPADRSNFLFLFEQGEGFGGYALQSDDLEADAAALQKRGLSVELRPPGGRARPDGQQLRWRMAAFPDTMTPFFVQDITPRNLRVPDDPSTTTHPNGALGIARLILQASPVQWAMYRDIAAGVAPENDAPFQLSDVEISLGKAEPGKPDRLYEIGLRTDNEATRHIIPTPGARLTLTGNS
jgi:hypothetical protein